MPFAFAFVGLLIFVIGIRGTHREAIELIRADFTGQGNFFTWIGAIMGIGALGYIKPIEPISKAFLSLVILVMFLSNEGFFARFQQQVFNRATPPATPTAAPGQAPQAGAPTAPAAIPALPSIPNLPSTTI